MNYIEFANLGSVNYVGWFSLRQSHNYYICTCMIVLLQCLSKVNVFNNMYYLFKDHCYMSMVVMFLKGDGCKQITLTYTIFLSIYYAMGLVLSLNKH